MVRLCLLWPRKGSRSWDHKEPQEVTSHFSPIISLVSLKGDIPSCLQTEDTAYLLKTLCVSRREPSAEGDTKKQSMKTYAQCVLICAAPPLTDPRPLSGVPSPTEQQTLPEGGQTCTQRGVLP